MRHASKVVFTVGELACMAGITKRRMARMLVHNGVRFSLTGAQNRRLVFLSEVEAALPELTDSIRFRREDDR